MPQHRAGKSGTRKYKRNEAKCKAYRLAKSVPNKRAKLRRHLARHPNDTCAQTASQKVGQPLSESAIRAFTPIFIPHRSAEVSC